MKLRKEQLKNKRKNKFPFATKSKHNQAQPFRKTSN